ncbi:ABC transporter ATP-binding protein [Actinoplanes sp. TFC3]|uniref:ABC transporter ATP-binding protein n=1 Tax=Actinoplanes sp. TFC3 TaxID=1710355 RepID=UPI00082EE380|nr:ATP-binding cassette domain-containing protein [Actinoplanes sp. TFC3]
MTTDQATPALDVAGLTHTAGSRRVLDDCSFAVPAGSVTALVGRNGAGKSTLLRTAVGLLRPDRGAVRVFGKPAGDEALPRIGYVGQQSPLYPMLTVAQTLTLGGRLNAHWDAGYARRLTGDAGLLPTTRVGSLTAGRRSRLALVMALAKRPDLLVLDEPLAPLDPVARAEVTGALMAGVAERGTTVMLSSHVVADIDGICDHVVVLAEGRVRLAAEVEQALTSHLVAVGASRALTDLDGGKVIEVRAAGSEATALIRSVEPVAATGLAWHRPTLEELILGYLRTPATQPERKVTAA